MSNEKQKKKDTTSETLMREYAEANKKLVAHINKVYTEVICTHPKALHMTDFAQGIVSTLIGDLQYVEKCYNALKQFGDDIL